MWVAPTLFAIGGLMPLFADTQFLPKLYGLRLCSDCLRAKRSFALAAMTSIGMPLVVHWAHINRRRWRDINRRWWRVIDRWWRCNVHGLWRNSASYDSSNTKSQDARSNCRTIAGMSRSGKCDCGNSCRRYGKASLMHMGDPRSDPKVDCGPKSFPSC